MDTKKLPVDQQAEQLANALEALAGVLRDEKLNSLLKSVHHSPQDRESLRSDAAGYLRQNGVALPHGVHVSAPPQADYLVFLCVDVLAWTVCVDYNEDGWHVHVNLS